MIARLFRRELGAYTRNFQFRCLLVLLIVLCAFASFDGWNRARQSQEIRERAEHHDRENWVNQGKNNPHGAAHFSRYAFRPTPALAALDPGIWDYAGSAVWMEAHHQNPATLRRAEDALGRTPVPGLSVAWIIRSLASLALLVLLFPAVAKEREQKTLRALAAAGVLSRDFVLGKVGGALVAIVFLSLIAFGIALVAGLVAVGELDLVRIAGMFGATCLALTAFGMSVIALSSRSASSGRALLMGSALWLFWAIGMPSLAAQLATASFPDLDEHTFRATVQKEAQSAFWSGEAKDREVARLEKEIHAKQGASALQELGYNKKGLVLQAHERHANAVFDLRFGELHRLHRRQDRTVALASFASPLLALQRLSSGLAGTDLPAQQSYAAQAEAHRRALIEQLNQDLMVHGGEKGMKYEADRALWETIADFDPEDLPLSEVFRNYALELVSLGAWTLLASVLAFYCTAVAMRIEERS